MAPCTHACERLHTHKHKHTHHTHTHTHTETHKHAHTHTHTQTHTHKHTYTNTNTHTHARTHTHIHTKLNKQEKGCRMQRASCLKKKLKGGEGWKKEADKMPKQTRSTSSPTDCQWPFTDVLCKKVIEVFKYSEMYSPLAFMFCMKLKTLRDLIPKRDKVKYLQIYS